MKHGETERHCLDIVKEILDFSICYACSYEESELISELFRTAVANPNASQFPDFICDGGFIEHFEITSSHSNRNGSFMKRELHKLDKEAKEKETAFKAEMNETPCFEGKSISTDTWHSTHSYDEFSMSFKRSWENHIDSLNKYTGNQSIGIFMIQYCDSALKMGYKYPDIKMGLHYGDLLERLQSPSYRLTCDSNLLEYIYQFNEHIKYVAFVNQDCFHGNRCEIISVENIPEIIKIVKEKYEFHCAMIGTAHTIYSVSVPNSLSKGIEDDDQT